MFFSGPLRVESYSELVMIDISQWRASIGLWYYQICDNSIDKSVLSKKRTRAKHQKLSNERANEATEQDDNSETPVVQPILSNSSTANTTMRYVDWCGRVQTISLAVFLFLLLILSGDIELNPGPKTAGK